MSRKRVPGKQLTQDNWDQDDDDYQEAESPSNSTASAEVIQNRKFAVAKRRAIRSPEAKSSVTEELSLKSVFTGFNFANNSSSTATIPTFIFNSTAFNSNSTTAINSNPQSDNKKNEEEDDADLYYKLLGDINKAFVKHINKFRNNQEFCRYDFSQICREYINYVEQLDGEKEKENGKDDSNTNTTSNNISTNNINNQPSGSSFAAPTTTPIFGFKSTEKANDNGANNKSNDFTSLPSTSTQSLFPVMYKFGSPKITETQKDSQTTASFPSSQDSQATITLSQTANEDDEEYVPPAPEEYKEDGSVFNTRCKLFYKNNDKWILKGTGSLNIIKKPNSTSSQLLIRSENANKTILLNIALASSLPIKKAEKKGALISCIPYPPIDGKEDDTVTFLIRVKEVDKLVDNLNQFKN